MVYSARVDEKVPFALVSTKSVGCELASVDDVRVSIPADRQWIHSRDGICWIICARVSRDTPGDTKTTFALEDWSDFRSKSSIVPPTCSNVAPEGSSEIWVSADSTGALLGSPGEERDRIRASLMRGGFVNSSERPEGFFVAYSSRFQYCGVLVLLDCVDCDDILDVMVL